MKRVVLMIAIAIINMHLFANQSWQPINGPFGGSIKKVFHSNGSYFVSCGLNQNLGGVWRLLPNNTWVNISFGLPKPFASDFAEIGTTLFIASDSSVMKTTNGGISWNEASGNLPNNTSVRRLIVHNNILFASIYFGSGTEELFYSLNEGSTWYSTGFSLMSTFNQLYSNGNKLWLATNNGVFLSTNNGLSWASKNNNIPFSASIYSIIAKGDTIYCGSSNGVYYSTNGANMWVQASNGLPSSSTIVYDFTIVGNYCYAGTQSNGVYSTVIGTNNWSITTPGLPQYTSVNSIYSRNNSLTIGTFEGFYHFDLLSGVWTLMNNGLSAAYIRSVYAEGNKIIASIGGNAFLFISTNGGASWSQCFITNSTYVRKIIKVSNNLYAATSNGIYISLDGGFSWSLSSSGIMGSTNCIAYNGTKFLAGTTSGLFQSSTGNSWSQITSIPSQSIMDITTFANTAYLILGGQKVYVSNNFGDTWLNQSNGLPVSNPFLQSIIISDSLAVVSSLYGLYRKTFSDTTWVNPNPSQTYIDILAISGRHLFATSSSNVLVSNDFGKSWHSFEMGLDPYIGSKISIFSSDTILYVGSETGGIWRRNITPELFTNSVNGLPFCGGGNITVNMSTNANYYQGNKFYIQLSDKMGRFLNPIKIDSITALTLPATKISIIPPNLEYGNNYKIRVVSTNPYVISKEYGLNIVINQKVSIQLHPANQSTCVGGNSGFYCGASGSGITYQWQVDNGTGFVNIVNNSTYQGTTNELLLLSNITSTMNGYKYRCIVSGYCPPSVNSNFGVLNVGIAPNILLHPADTNVCIGTQAKFKIQASGTNITYQWQCDNATGVFSNIANSSTYSGTNTSTLTIANTQIIMNGYKYRCLLSSCLPTNPATLTIMSAPVIASINNFNTCLNGNATFTASVSGLVAYYQWQVNFGAGFINIYNGANYYGTDSCTLIINNVTSGMNGYQYRCMITTFCSPFYFQTNSATLFVNSNSLNISNQPQDAIVCENEKAYFVVTATGLGLSYQWQYKSLNSWVNVQNTAPFFGANNDTLKIDIAKYNYNGYKFRCVLSTCLLSDSAILVVNPKPNILITPSSVSNLCSGDSITFSSNTGLGWVFNWFYNNLPINSSNNNYITVYQAGFYKVEAVTPYGCKDTSNSVQVNVSPLPIINIGNDTTICNDQNLTLYAGNGYLNYLWSNNANYSNIIVNSTNYGIGNHQIWVKVTDNNGCIGSDTVVVSIFDCTIISEIENSLFKIFPIPAKEYLYINFPHKTANVQLFSFDGKIVFERNFENCNSITILTKDFKSGVYLFKINSDKQTKVFRIILI